MMDSKLKLSALAALGLLAGSMNQAHAACTPPSTAEMNTLFSQLDAEHQAMFNAMSCEGKNLAMKMANQSCKGKNSCKGMNSCKTAKNSCAGQGACKGVTPGPFTDKNEAIEMANKRMQTMSSGG